MELTIIKLIAEFGSFGLIAWLVYRTFTKTLPDMAKMFREQIERERESADEARADFVAELKEIREERNRAEQYHRQDRDDWLRKLDAATCKYPQSG